MPEILNSQTENQQTKEAKAPTSIGTVERISMATLNENKGAEDSKNTNADTGNENKNNTEGANATPKANENGAAKTDNAAPAPTPLTEQQIKEWMESQGVKFESLEQLKEKVNYTPPKELSPEDKKAQELAQEKRRVDYYVANGGTIEMYVSLKKIVESDPAQLSIDIAKTELKEAGFTDEQTEEILRERYYQINEDDLAKLEDETDKEFVKRKKEYGAKKLANRSQYTQTQASAILQGLDEVLQSEDLQVSNEAKMSANIDDQFKAVPRNSTFEMGKINGEAILPIEYDVPEAALSEIQSTWKDPAQRKQLLYNQDGTLNVTKLIDMQVRNIALESAVKAAFHEGGSRQVSKFKEVFPNSAYELGVGNNGKKPNGEKGAVASSGKPVRVPMPQQ